MNQLIVVAFVEIAYLIVGFGLCLLGKQLIEKGVESKFEAEGAFGERTMRILTTSPGIVFMLGGVGVIGAAILQTADISEKFAETPPGIGPDAGGRESEPVPLVQLVERSVSFGQPSANRGFAEQQVQIAKARLRDGRGEEASTSLAIAVVLDPQLLGAILSDTALDEATRDPRFEQIARGRLALPQGIAPMAVSSLSPMAREILLQLRDMSEFAPSQTSDNESSRRLADILPDAAGREAPDETLRNLTKLLQHDPAFLLRALETSDHAWLLEDEVLMEGVRSAIDRYQRGT